MSSSLLLFITLIIFMIISIFCFYFYHFVECLNMTFKNSWYIISVREANWLSSWLWDREACQNQGGDLVSIETEDEWNFINDQIQRRDITRYENKWNIGLTKKAGNWTWVNGRLLTICKWEQGEPRGEHHAAFMYKRTSNGEQGVFVGVNVMRIGYVHAYICEISEGKLLFLLLFCFCLFAFFNIILRKLAATEALRHHKNIIWYRLWSLWKDLYKPFDSQNQVYTNLWMNENMFETISINVFTIHMSNF